MKTSAGAKAQNYRRTEALKIKVTEKLVCYKSSSPNRNTWKLSEINQVVTRGALNAYDKLTRGKEAPRLKERRTEALSK